MRVRCSGGAQRPVETFLPVGDGGRDGAFLGAWEGTPGKARLKSTLQCKFTSKADARLSLTQLRTELEKVPRLAAQGLAHDYVLMTNAGVTGRSNAAICRAFENAGAKTCQIFDGDWIMRQVMERPRLRMMVPRLYGLLGLEELITGPAYEQARAILGSMGHDLASFVPTASHRAAVDALQKHGFVLLLGDPATGKSTIAATLALGALDGGCTGAVKISSPDQLHLWRPGERQFLWVDDAFGATQYEPARVQRWNAELPSIRAAVRDGAKVVFTSRYYIWRRARDQLKLGTFPPLKSSQVVVDVQALPPGERARILYNHVRNGGHAQATRRALKPFLAQLAENPALTPEIARRLGDPFLTQAVKMTLAGLVNFVERPVEFLREVILNLGEAGRAALALVFMHAAAGIPSPVQPGLAMETVLRLTGTRHAEISRELEAMSAIAGSSNGHERGWKHACGDHRPDYLVSSKQPAQDMGACGSAPCSTYQRHDLGHGHGDWNPFWPAAVLDSPVRSMEVDGAQPNPGGGYDVGPQAVPHEPGTALVDTPNLAQLLQNGLGFLLDHLDLLEAVPVSECRKPAFLNHLVARSHYGQRVVHFERGEGRLESGRGFGHRREHIRRQPPRLPNLVRGGMRKEKEQRVLERPRKPRWRIAMRLVQLDVAAALQHLHQCSVDTGVVTGLEQQILHMGAERIASLIVEGLDIPERVISVEDDPGRSSAVHG